MESNGANTMTANRHDTMTTPHDKRETFQARPIRKTARATLLAVSFAFHDGVTVGGDVFEYEREVWFPTSQVRDEGGGFYSVPSWLARDRGLSFDSYAGPGVNGAT